MNLSNFALPLFFKATASTLLTGLVAYWNLDSDSNSQFGGVNGTDTNANHSNAGKIGNCFTSTGSGYVAFGNTSTLALTSAMAISLWFNVPTMGSYQFLCTRMVGSGGGNSTYELRITPGGNLDFCANGGVGPQTVNSFSANTWYHVAVNRDSSGNITIYVNNVSQSLNGSASHTASTDPNSHAFLGTRDDGFTTFQTNGKIDEVGIWNRVLTVAEISTLYNAGSGKTYPF